MNIESSSNIVKIDGNIKSISDFQQIKRIVDSLVAIHKNIIINIIDSISLTSSVIGYLNKLVLKDKIGISINIGSSQLMELIDDLNLTSTFKAKRI